MTEVEPMAATHIDRDRLKPLLMRRKPVHHAKVPFILCWSQKAGCTAALKWFLHHAGLLEDALAMDDPNRRLKIHSYENKVLKARRGYTDDMISAIQFGKPLLGFMRCPYERAFSSYMILNHGRYLRMQLRGVINPGMKLRQTIVEGVYGSGADFGNPLSFADYLHWLKQQDYATVNPHHAPQILPLHRELPVRFYRLGDFDRAIHEIENEFGMETSRTKREHFSSGHHRPKVDTPQADAVEFLQTRLGLDAYPLKNLPAISRRVLANTELGILIRDIFAKDIAAYDAIPPIN